MIKLMLLCLAFATSPQSLFSEALQQYTGTYRVNGIGTAMKVWIEEERLYTDLGQQGLLFELVQDQDLQFAVQFSGSQTELTLTFEQKDNQIIAFRLGGHGEKDVHCLRVEK
ncbi:MAG: DUF3471 domain-containing protein [Bacteroidota bacterium]